MFRFAKVNYSGAICRDCAFALVVYGYRAGEEVISCSYGGPIREVKFAVRACSAFLPREMVNSRTRVDGFVAIEPAEITMN